jgi:hypothetical protein
MGSMTLRVYLSRIQLGKLVKGAWCSCTAMCVVITKTIMIRLRVRIRVREFILCDLSSYKIKCLITDLNDK